MSTQKVKKLSLIIQVYQGGFFLKECLDSVKQNLSFFTSIYISINKSYCSDDDIQTVCSFKEKIKKSLQDGKIDIIIFTQNIKLSAIEHSRFFYKNILRHDKGADFFMILCHDDIILPAFSENISSIIANLNDNEILNPARSYYTQSFLEENYIGSYYGLLSYQYLKTTKENFAAKGLDCYPETNITGLILPKKALTEFRKVLPLFSYGYRAEYIMMFVPSIEYVKSSSRPLVAIRRHKMQEGAQFIQKAYEHDEQLYRFYMWYVTRNRSFRNRIKDDISFFEKKLPKFLKMLYLHFSCFMITKSLSCFVYSVCMIPLSFLLRGSRKLKKIVKSLLLKFTK